MKRKIVLSLFVLFLFFTAGAVLTALYITNTTSTLSRLISLHQVELLREGLVINIQTVQSDLYTVHTPLGRHLDSIVNNVQKLEQAADGCRSCHHNPELTRRIGEVHDLIGEYENSLSYYITASADTERIEKLKMDAAETGNRLLGLTQEMTFTASKKLQEITRSALIKIENARVILFVTLICALFLALWVAVHLTRAITYPVNELVNSARMIASGHLGFSTSYRDKTEFGELAESFNMMSAALKGERERIDRYIGQLSGLYHITLSFYKIADSEDSYREICRHVAELVGVKQCILILFDNGKKMFVPYAFSSALSEGAVKLLSVSPQKMGELFRLSNGLPLISNNGALHGRFEPVISDSLNEGSILVSWLHRKGKVRGAIRVADKDGNFTDEDAKLLTILANHMAVAMENTQLYKSLQGQMAELKEAQEQLIQSAKLAAIGELAANMAHEINTPLTSIIGFTEIIKDESDIGIIRNRLDIIEKESMRARDIVRGLLHFAKKRPLQLSTLDMNQVMREVMPLIESQARMNNVEIMEEYGELPGTVGDPNQLKQVFINIINNAVSSMSGGGKLFVRTTRQGDCIMIGVRDTGHGIPKDQLRRIFEPFYTTKKDKGTGLGLSISDRIIREHGGKIEVESIEDQGSTFTVTLPVKPALPL
jgi:signal transduction histidine kinase/HAMP domain-containing protein